jgi:hypothetical protein
MAQVAVEREFGGEERGPEFGDEFFRRIGRLPKPTY